MCQYAADKLECLQYIKRSLYHAFKDREMIVRVGTFKVAAKTRKTSLNIDPSISDVDVRALLASVHSGRLIQIR